MKTLVADGSGNASNAEFQVRAGYRYSYGHTNRSDNDADGSSYGAEAGTVVPSVISSDTYTRTSVAAVAAAVTTAISGANNDLVFTAVEEGLAGNSITVEYVNTAVPSQALELQLSGSAITVNLALDAGTAQVETMTIVGTVTLAGTVDWEFTSALTGTISGSVNADLNDSAIDVGILITAALQANATISEHWTITNAGDEDIIIATAKVAAADDATANMGYDNGTATGMTGDATSTNTTAGVAPAITTTADELKTAILADDDISALITADDAAANDGSGVLVAMSPATLASGSDAVTAEDAAVFPALDPDGAEITWDLATAANRVAGFEFISPATGTFSLGLTGATAGKLLHFNVARQVQG
jgi:hypothetical protein